MVKSNELRRMNWVESTIGNHTAMYQVDRIEDTCVWLLQYPCEKLTRMVECENIEPILINLEILEKCGFRKDLASVWSLTNNPFYISEVMISNGNSAKQINYHTEFLSRNLSIKYLHQLQNLHFALTETELQISALNLSNTTTSQPHQSIH